MNKPALLLVGAGGHALSCIDVIEREGRFHIAGLTGLSEELGTKRLGYPVIGTDSDLPDLFRSYQYAFVTLGQIKSPALRTEIFLRLQQLGFVLPTIVSPDASVSAHATLGAGTIVMHGACVNAGASVGDNCILNTRALVEHGVRMGSHCHLATGAILNGDANVGEGTFIGSGAVVREGIRIGKQCLIGMGQLVRADCADGARLPAGKEGQMKTLIIAEAGVNHDGELPRALQLIEVAAAAGADLVKFQTFRADALAAAQAPKAAYQNRNMPGNESQHAMLKRLELDAAMHKTLMQHCRACGIGFFSSAFDLASVDLLASLGLERWKIPSGEITNLPYLRKVGSFAQPVILSSGMSTLDEIEAALRVLERAGTARSLVTVLHCNTEYPTPMQDVNLRAMLAIRETCKVAVGYSDHTVGIEVAIAATALGASVIEKHFTLDRNLPGPDHKASLEPDELKAMVRAIRNIEQALGDGNKRPSASESGNLQIARKSIVAASAIRKGERFSVSNLAIKRPGGGLSPMRWDEILGQHAARDFGADEYIEL